MRLAFPMCRAVLDTWVSGTYGSTHYRLVVVWRIASRLVAFARQAQRAVVVAQVAVVGFAAAVVLGLGGSLSASSFFLCCVCVHTHTALLGSLGLELSAALQLPPYSAYGAPPT